MSVAFHDDQLRVAREEFVHSQLVAEYLIGIDKPRELPVHHRLWDSARACDNLGEHLVVIPRFLEARGLDVSAEIIDRVAEIDRDAHAVLHRIYLDEIGHVETGPAGTMNGAPSVNLIPSEHFAQVLNKQGCCVSPILPRWITWPQVGFSNKPAFIRMKS